MALQRVYSYIRKLKNTPKYRLPHLVWNVEDLLELLSDPVKYVLIEERLMDPLRKKWKFDAKRTKLEYYFADINLECWVLYKTRRPIDRI